MKYWNLMRTDREADLHIFGSITVEKTEEGDVSGGDIVQELKDLDADRLTVHINSYGGDVSEGFAIYNTLKGLQNSGVEVVTACEGFACSAASTVFMAGSRRQMSDVSLMMIHNASTLAVGTADELRKAADDVELIDSIIRQVYVANSTLDEAQIRTMMDRETWISPQQALGWGFATEIVSTASDLPTNSVGRAVQNAVLQMQEPPKRTYHTPVIMEVTAPDVKNEAPAEKPEPEQKSHMRAFFDRFKKE